MAKEREVSMKGMLKRRLLGTVLKTFSIFSVFSAIAAVVAILVVEQMPLFWGITVAILILYIPFKVCYGIIKRDFNLRLESLNQLCDAIELVNEEKPDYTAYEDKKKIDKILHAFEIVTDDEIGWIAENYGAMVRSKQLTAQDANLANYDKRRWEKRGEKLKQEKEVFESHAEHDPLTGLLNRKGFEERADNLLRENAYNMSAYIMIDQDNFKGVNDGYGHMTGDEVLKRTARILRNSFRSGDLVARVGGDEFCAFLPHIAGKDWIEERLDSIERNIKEEFTCNGMMMHVSVSIGAAIYPEAGGSIEELYSSADKALYAAKDAGKGRFEVYSPLRYGNTKNTVTSNLAGMETNFTDSNNY